MGSRRVVSAVLVPLGAGFVASGMWAIAGSSRRYYITGSVVWVPVLIGAVLSVALVLWVAGAERGRLEERIALASSRQADTARHRRFIARLDHELKNPVQGIEVALADEPSDRQRESIAAQSRRLARLVGDLRKVGEVEQTTLERSAVDLVDLVADAVAGAHDLHAASDRHFVMTFPSAPRPLPPVMADGDLLFVALSNLLANAVKFSAPGDTIEVRGRETQGWATIEVADTGRGIADQDRDVVWEELGRGHDAHDVDGSGLGLPLVRAIVARHDGRCEIESQLGTGSTVRIWLPAR